MRSRTVVLFDLAETLFVHRRMMDREITEHGAQLGQWHRPE